MKDSYRGNMRTSAPSMINSKGFIGPNKGPIYNLLTTANAIGKVYSSLPATIRWGIFGDEDAWREDQNSPNPIYDEYGEKRHPKRHEDDVEETEWRTPDDVTEEDVEYDYDENGNSYDDEGGDGRMESEREAYEAGKEATPKDPTPVDDDYDDWYKSTEITTVTPEEGVKSMEFEDSSALEWQKFLNEQGYKLKANGKWDDKSQEAYDDWVSKNPDKAE